MSYQEDPEYLRLAEKVGTADVKNVAISMVGKNLHVKNGTAYGATLEIFMIDRGYLSSKKYEQRIQIGADMEETFDFEYPIESVKKVVVEDCQLRIDQNRMQKIKLHFACAEEIKELYQPPSNIQFQVESHLNGNRIVFTCEPSEILTKLDLVANMSPETMKRLINYCKLNSQEFILKSEVTFNGSCVEWVVKVTQVESQNARNGVECV